MTAILRYINTITYLLTYYFNMTMQVTEVRVVAYHVL